MPQAKIPFLIRFLLQLYDVVWLILIPFLKQVKKLNNGFANRTLEKIDFGQVDIWIHTASAGEAYIARQILTILHSPEKLKILATSITQQGREILEKPLNAKNYELTVTYAPFDRPSLCRKAVAIADPKLLVLIESEIWPGILAEMNKAGKKIIIINGRMTIKSFSRYMKTRYVWSNLQPDRILAISEDDRKRFATLFGTEKTFQVNNIKFDSIEKCILSERKESPVPFLVLASIRKEEEDQLIFIINQLLKNIPKLQIGLFPRHMDRLAAWKKLLAKNNIRWALKSSLQLEDNDCEVILWDVFGELKEIYRKADAAFIGGSLAPLGGQNFIEAFMNGVIPVTGPYVDNFLWVGDEVYSQELVKRGNNKEEVLSLLIETLQNRADGSVIQKNADQFIKTRQGGSELTCKHIVDLLKNNHEIILQETTSRK